jgi:hypothetical protein
MGADKSTESTPNAPKFIFPNCLSKPKSLVHISMKKGLIGRPLSVKCTKAEEKLTTLLFYQIQPLKNKPFLILPSSHY